MAYLEGRNVRRAMAEVLGLESTASIASCMQCLTHLMSRQSAKADKEVFVENVMDPDGQAAAAAEVVEAEDLQKLPPHHVHESSLTHDQTSKEV